MNWKTRQLFSDREHGIVSGLSPVNMMGGGSVPIPGYQTGGLALDLFEEGDEEINAPLNMMAQAVSPSLDIGPTGPMLEETIDEETALMDQGLTPESGAFENALNMLKESFKEEIRNYVVQVMEPQKVKQYLDNMNMTYANALNKLKSKHGVEAYSPNEELLDPLFIEEITQLMAGGTQELPGYEDGGVILGEGGNVGQELLNTVFGTKAPKASWWNTLSKEDQKILYDQHFMNEMITGNTGVTGPDTSTLNTLLKDRKALAGKIGKAARGSYSSSLPRILHYGAAKSAGELAEAEAMDKTLADQISAERGILSAYGRGTSGSSMRLPADVLSKIHLPEEIRDTLKQYNALIKEYTDNGFEAPNSRATFRLADMGDYPPGSAYRKKIGPLDWLTYYSEEKDKIPTTIDENGIEMFGDPPQPILDIEQQYSVPYLRELIKIEQRWLSGNL